MATVHVFVSTDRFRSFEEMRFYIDEMCTDEGDGIPAPFIREVGLSERRIPLPELLGGSSYWEQWLSRLGASTMADAAICVFEPNQVEHPQGSSLEHCGAFEYDPNATA